MTSRNACNFWVRVALCVALCTQVASAAEVPLDSQNRGQKATGDDDTGGNALPRVAEDVPENPSAAYNRGVAFAAKGDAEQAEACFRRAAALDDRPIAVRAWYNLGCVASEKARRVFGDHPEEVSPEVRQRGMELVDQAAGHFRECLRLDEHHADARYNLEVLRLWAAQVRNAWRARHPKPEARSPLPEKQPPATAPPQKSAKSGPPKEDNKTKPPHGSSDGKGRSSATRGPAAPGKASAPSPAPKTKTTPQDEADELFSKVRERAEAKRQWDRQRATPQEESREEKDW